MIEITLKDNNNVLFNKHQEKRRLENLIHFCNTGKFINKDKEWEDILNGNFCRQLASKLPYRLDTRSNEKVIFNGY